MLVLTPSLVGFSVVIKEDDTEFFEVISLICTLSVVPGTVLVIILGLVGEGVETP